MKIEIRLIRHATRQNIQIVASFTLPRSRAALASASSINRSEKLLVEQAAASAAPAPTPTAVSLSGLLRRNRAPSHRISNRSRAET